MLYCSIITASFSFVAFLSAISAFVGLPALAGPAIGILAKSFLHKPTSPRPTLAPSIMDILDDMTDLALRGLNLSAVHATEFTDFNIAMNSIVALMAQDVPDCDEKREVLRLLLDMRRASVKVLFGMEEFANVLHFAAKRFIDGIEYRESVAARVDLFACLLPFGAYSVPSLDFHGLNKHFFNALSDDCDTALDILDQFHTELSIIVDDFWPRFDRQIVLGSDDLAFGDECVRCALAKFALVARRYFGFAAATEFKTTSFYLALSRAHEAADDFLTSM